MSLSLLYVLDPSPAFTACHPAERLDVLANLLPSQKDFYSPNLMAEAPPLGCLQSYYCTSGFKPSSQALSWGKTMF